MRGIHARMKEATGECATPYISDGYEHYVETSANTLGS